MPERVSPLKVVRFGNFEADLPAGQLRKHGIKVKLVDQSFEVLAILLENAGEVVAREDLRRGLWPEDAFGDFDNNLNTAIARLRQVLSDSVTRPRFIETLPKRGYRFIAPVLESAPARRRLLVLPFLNLSGDPAQEYFSDAMTEEIIGELANLAPERLAVIARTTAMHYKGTQKDIARIASESGVEYVIEGSLRRDGEQLSVSVQLIQAVDQMHLLARKYNAPLRDLFQIEKAIAQTVAQEFGVTPRPCARKHAGDLRAYDRYIQGRYHWAKGTPEGAQEAKKYYEEAVALNPEFALAYDALAELYWYLGFVGFAVPRDVLSLGVYYARRAIEIDDTLAEARGGRCEFSTRRLMRIGRRSSIRAVPR